MSTFSAESVPQMDGSVWSIISLPIDSNSLNECVYGTSVVYVNDACLFAILHYAYFLMSVLIRNFYIVSMKVIDH